MKALIQAIVIAATFAAPVAVFAQANQQPLTRAQVKEQLVQVENAGYNPARMNPNSYANDIQAAEAHASGQNGAQGGAASSSWRQGHATGQ